MDNLAITAFKCANKIMAKRNEHIEFTESEEWLNIDIHHKDRIGIASFRKDSLKLLDLLWHIHFYATPTNYYPFNYYHGMGKQNELANNNFMAY